MKSLNLLQQAAFFLFSHRHNERNKNRWREWWCSGENHKAERENNINNKQKLGRELVGTGKGRRGRQGTWWGTREGTTTLAGFRCAVEETPAGCLPPRPPNPGATTRDCHRNSKHIWCVHLYPQREFKSPWWNRAEIWAPVESGDVLRSEFTPWPVGVVVVVDAANSFSLC